MQPNQFFSKLGRNKKKGYYRPHKPAMLLAVLDLAESGMLKDNRIFYAPPLLERFERYFAAVCRDDDVLNPHHPFFHLKNDGFWYLVPKSGRDEQLKKMKSSDPSRIRKDIEYAFLDSVLFEAIQDPAQRSELREYLISRYFPEHATELARMVLGKP